MPYCIHCGVKLSDLYENCPLCKLEMEFPEERVNIAPLYPEAVHKMSIIQPVRSQKEWVMSHFSTFITMMLLLITGGIDYYQNQQLTWSRISGTSIGLIYLVINTSFYLRRNPYILYTILNVYMSLFLLILDRLTSSYNWFYQYALPCLISLQLISLLINRLFIKIHGVLRRSITVILLTNIFLLIINEITSKKISWSLITTSILLPTALYLSYLEWELHHHHES